MVIVATSKQLPFENMSVIIESRDCDARKYNCRQQLRISLEFSLRHLKAVSEIRGHDSATAFEALRWEVDEAGILVLFSDLRDLTWI